MMEQEAKRSWEELKDRHFPLEDRQGRIARSLETLCGGTGIRLTVEEWKRIAEDPDVEDADYEK